MNPISLGYQADAVMAEALRRARPRYRPLRRTRLTGWLAFHPRAVLRERTLDPVVEP
jgi:hypothetical protein